MSPRQIQSDDSFSFWLSTGIAVLTLSSIILLVRRIEQKASRPAVSGDEQKNPISPRGCLMVFGSVFVIAGLLGLLQTAIRPAYRSMQADRWPTVPGVVTSSQVVKSSSRKRANFRADIHYRYVVYAKPFESNQFDSRGTSSYDGNRQHQQSIVDAHPPGKAVTVHYNPADPGEAMLSTTLPDGTLTSVLVALFVVGGGVVIMFLPPSVISGAKRKPVAAKATPQAAVEVGATAVRRKRAGLALILGTFAVFWNTFVAFFIYAGDGTWCILPFALVGLFLIFITIQSALKFFNPAVSVTFARMPLRPGEPTNVSFSIAGNLFAVRQLTFTLEGRETAAFSQGKRSSIDIHVAWRIPCFETTKHVDMESGRFTIDLPADVMTTFVANNNQFTWHLICRGDVPGRPDIKDEFDVTVLPHPKRGDR